MPSIAMARISALLSGAERKRLAQTSRTSRQQQWDAFLQPTAEARIGTTLVVSSGGIGVGVGAAAAVPPPSLEALGWLFGGLQPCARGFASVRLDVMARYGADGWEGGVWEGFDALIRRLVAVEGAAECVTEIRLAMFPSSSSSSSVVGGGGGVGGGGTTTTTTMVNTTLRRLGAQQHFTRVRRIELVYVLGSSSSLVAENMAPLTKSKRALTCFGEALGVLQCMAGALSPTETVVVRTTTTTTTNITSTTGVPPSFHLGMVGLARHLTTLCIGPFGHGGGGGRGLQCAWTSLEEALTRMECLRVLSIRGVATAPLTVRLRMDRALALSSATLESVRLEVSVNSHAERTAMLIDAQTLCAAAPRLVCLCVGLATESVAVAVGDTLATDPLLGFPARLTRLRVFQHTRSTLAETLVLGMAEEEADDD
jgi:hypothetical protein